MTCLNEIKDLVPLVKSLKPAEVYSVVLGEQNKSDIFDRAFALGIPFNYQEGEFNQKGTDIIAGKMFYSRSIQYGDENINKELRFVDWGSYAFVDPSYFDDEIIVKLISRGIKEIVVERLFPINNDDFRLLDFWLSPLLKNKCNDFRGYFLFELFKSPSSFNSKAKLISLWNKTELWIEEINSSVWLRDGQKIFIRMSLC